MITLYSIVYAVGSPVLVTVTGGVARRRLLILSLNASAIYLGQGAGAGIGALVLLYGSLASLGWVAAACTMLGLVVLLCGPRSGVRSHEGEPDENYPASS